jgi:hypothetical protein
MEYKENHIKGLHYLGVCKEIKVGNKNNKDMTI